jgi:hypothetical protein
MSYTVMANPNNTGVRRLQTLGAWGLGAVSDLAQTMIGDGYDPGVIISLSTAGASDAQLQSLYDNYGAGTQEFADAANGLLTQLTGGPGGAASAPGYPAGAQPTTISTAFGVYDLTQQSAWDAINSQFSSTQRQLNSLAAQAPKDPDVSQMVQDFNGIVGQWANYYDQAFGSAPSPIPFASIPTLGIAPLVVLAGLAIGVAAVLGTLYLLNQRILAKAQAVQAQASLTATQSQSTAATASQAQAANLMRQANALPPSQAAQIAALTAQANALLAQSATAVTPVAPIAPPGATNWNAWIQQNFGLIVLAAAAVVIGPQLVKKL